MSNVITDYLYGYMPLNEQILITALLFVPVAVIWLYYRHRTVTSVISQEINGVKPDTPYIADGPRLPRGNFIVWCWEIARDTFMKVFYYNSFTVWRLKKEGKTDWRQYVVKPLQMQTINWDNCTYNVYEDCMVPVRGASVMLIIEGCTEPIKLKYFFDWSKLVDIVSENVNKANYDKWDDATKDLVGEWKPDGFLFHSKMNNRNTEKMALAGVPNLNLMFYCVIGTLIIAGLIYASMQGWMSSGLMDRVDGLHNNLVEIYQQVKK